MLPGWNSSWHSQGWSAGAAAGPVFATWQPGSGGTLSNGNRTSTSATGSDSSFTNIGPPITGGKRYFELTMGATVPSQYLALVGSDNSYPFGWIQHFLTSGNIDVNNGVTSALGPSPVAGDTVGYAIDFANMRLWVTKDGVQWNNSSSNNPNTPSTGLDISAAADVGTTGFNCLIAFGAIGESLTGNWGQVGFLFMPSGYSHW